MICHDMSMKCELHLGFRPATGPQAREDEAQELGRHAPQLAVAAFEGRAEAPADLGLAALAVGGAPGVAWEPGVVDAGAGH